ncbi:unnamed protein product [Cylicocyclus nassatus]|uniref:Fatty-acid and retinol-binding protein 1 n=1 Tax=Cylicocyclus nassatus TaxID=53992 RepID=A0AA36GQV6_CYLNA|nr:unnamed protein product [Cylicocyclus nassatus]
MLRITFFFALVVVYTFSAPAEEKIDVEKMEKFEDIPQQYRDLIPEEVATHIKAITAEEKAVLKELMKDYAKYKDEEEFLKAIKEKSESLHEKASKFHNFIKGKVDALGDEAKAFVKKVIAAAREVHAKLLAGDKPSLEDIKKKAKEHMGEFEKLSNDAKEDLKKNFPILTSVFTNEKAKAMIDKYVEN